MRKMILILFVLTLIGVLLLEVVTFVKMLNANESLPNIEYLRRLT